MDSILEIKNFSKTYKGGKRAVEDLSLTVCPGDIYGFIGANGAGKTTTIKCIVGALDFREGEIYIDSHSVKDEPIAAKSIIGYVPDNPDLYEYLTGIQYLNYMAAMFKVDKNTARERTEKYASLFNITENLPDLISSYSHGMKQKLVLIGTFLHSPRLIVLDEPFVGLDPVAASQLKNIMHELCTQGCGIFFSTHVLEVAEKLCNKIAVLKDGKLLAHGPIDEVKGKDSLENVFLELMEK